MRIAREGESILVGRRWSAAEFGFVGLAALWVETVGCRWSALAHPTLVAVGAVGADAAKRWNSPNKADGRTWSPWSLSGQKDLPQ